MMQIITTAREVGFAMPSHTGAFQRQEICKIYGQVHCYGLHNCGSWYRHVCICGGAPHSLDTRI